MVECAAGGDDVDARREQPTQLVKVERIRHVEHTVRAEFDDLLDAGRGVYARGFPAAQLAGVTARLLRPVDVDTGEGHVRVFDDRLQRAGSKGPCGPLGDSVATVRLLVSSVGRQWLRMHQGPQLANRKSASWA